MLRPLPDLLRAADDFRERILLQEAAAAARMTELYLDAEAAIRQQLQAIQQRIAEARAAGQPPGISWAFQEERLARLQATAVEQLQRFASGAEEQITRHQRAMVRQAERDAAIMASGVAGAPPGRFIPWQRLPTAVLEEFAGITAVGSPVRRLLSELPGQGGRVVERVLIQSLATGAHPREMARRMRSEMGMALNRALTIARTEGMRAYREASRHSYLANSRVVHGWVWHATLGPRTCAACLAMHGSYHELRAPLGSHPRCRCTMIPVVASWKELINRKLSPPPLQIETGEDWLVRQSAAMQEQVLGEKGRSLWLSGELELGDFVRRGQSTEWGVTRTAASVRQAQENASWRLQTGKGYPGFPDDMDVPLKPSPLLPPDRPEPLARERLQHALGGATRAAVSSRTRYVGSAREHAERLVSLIDRVHVDGNLPELWIDEYLSGNEYLGLYRTAVHEISLARGARGKPLTIVHEIGHALSFRGMWERGKSIVGAAAAADPAALAAYSRPEGALLRAVRRWYDAAAETRAVQGLRALRASAAIQRLRTATGGSFLEYVLDPEEIWARAYSQYIAVRSGDQELLAEVGRVVRRRDELGRLMQWDANDFEPVARAMDELFENLGWRNGNGPAGTTGE